jgi:hypothetical protein
MVKLWVQGGMEAKVAGASFIIFINSFKVLYFPYT